MVKRNQKSAVGPDVEDALRVFGAGVRRLRLSKRLSVAASAARAGVSPSTLIRVEKGDPSVAMGSYSAVFDVFGLLARMRELVQSEAQRATLLLAEERMPSRVRSSSRYDF